jgi:hypothetical protein
MDILFNKPTGEKKYKVTFQDNYIVEVESSDVNSALVEAKLLYRMAHNNVPPQSVKEVKNLNENKLESIGTRMLFD